MAAPPSRAASTQAPLQQHMDGLVQLLGEGTMRVIQLNRPKALNAMNEEMVVEFGKALEVRTPG